MKNWKKLIFGCTIGNVLTVYDFILYGYFAHIISSLFFPKENQTIALILVFSVFASGCLIRPFGAVLFGHIGDKFGRKKALILSISLMAISTTLVGLLPTYQQIGVYAPYLLILCRLLQGLSICGEETGAAIFLVENAPKNKQAFAGSIIFGSIYFGLFMGSVITFLITSSMNQHDLYLIGWRLPFIFAFFIGIVAIVVRKKQFESIAFKKVIDGGELLKKPFVFLMKNYLSKTIKAIGLVSLMAVLVYTFSVYMPTFFNISDGISLKESMLICSFGFFLATLFVMMIGYLSDKIGVIIPTIASCIASILLAYVVFLLLEHNTIISSIFAEIIMVILLGLTAGSIMPILINIFPTKVCSTGVNIAFNLGMTFFGSTAPILAVFLSKTFHSTKAPSLYVMAVAIVTLIALFSLLKSKN